MLTYLSELARNKFISIHGSAYDYSQLHYRQSDQNVNIRCLNHGLFELTPVEHANGQGCPKCEMSSTPVKKVWKTRVPGVPFEDYVSKARVIHGDKYTYSPEGYINSNSKIAITCTSHGVFFATFHNHFRSKGCPTCWRIEKYKSNEVALDSTVESNAVIEPLSAPEVKSHIVVEPLPQDAATLEYIEQANAVHNNKYTYENAAYFGPDFMMKITCPIHGEFERNAYVHLQGLKYGCKKCMQVILKAKSKKHRR